MQGHEANHTGHIKQFYKCFGCNRWTRRCAGRIRRYGTDKSPVAVLALTPCCDACFSVGLQMTECARRGREFEEWQAVSGLGYKVDSSDATLLTEDTIIQIALEAGDHDLNVLSLWTDSGVFREADSCRDEVVHLSSDEVAEMNRTAQYMHVDVSHLLALQAHDCYASAGPAIDLWN